VSYRLLPHTADLRAEVRGADLGSLYGAAAALVRAVLVGDSAVQARETRRLDVAGADEAERFFRFVRELVYLFDAEGFLPAEVRSVEPPVVAGEPFAAERHVGYHQLKAVTRHGYRFLRRPDGGYEAELVFDL
jgi:SHS2 domain-containing protein